MIVRSRRVIHKDKLTAAQKEQRRQDKIFRYHMLTEFYKLAGMNSKGEPPKEGWGDQALGGLSKTDPILDPDYQPPDTPDRLTFRELKELL